MVFYGGEMIRRPGIGQVLGVGSRRAAKLERALAAPDDGYCTTYDEAGHVLQRIPLHLMGVR